MEIIAITVLSTAVLYLSIKVNRISKKVNQIDGSLSDAFSNVRKDLLEEAKRRSIQHSSLSDQLDEMLEKSNEDK